jgi:hypothetical protein
MTFIDLGPCSRTVKVVLSEKICIIMDAMFYHIGVWYVAVISTSQGSPGHNSDIAAGVSLFLGRENM